MTRRWTAFWFAPTDPATLGVVRIAVGVLALLWALSLAPDLGAFYGSHGVVGDAAPAHPWWEWSLLSPGQSDLAVGAVYVALVAGALGMVAGWHSRISAAVVFVTLTSLARANPYVVNSGDTLVRLLALYVMIAPAGMAYSIDRRRAAPDASASHPAWPLRLIQIQVSVMYLAAVWTKLHGPTWRDGTAASYAMRVPDLVRFPAPSLFEHSVLAAKLATYGTILVEAGLAVLIWNRRTRVPALLAGVALHLSIDMSIRVGFFTLAVFVGFLSFVEPVRVRAAVSGLSRAYAHSSPGRSRRGRIDPSIDPSR